MPVRVSINELYDSGLPFSGSLLSKPCKLFKNTNIDEDEIIQQFPGYYFSSIHNMIPPLDLKNHKVYKGVTIWDCLPDLDAMIYKHGLYSKGYNK